MNLTITKEATELLRVAAKHEWGMETTVEIKIKNGEMEEVL